MRRDRPLGHLVDRFWRATINTWNGLVAATRSEAAFREELVVMAVAVPLSFVIGTGAWHRVVLIAVVLLVLVVELLNTGLEKLADAITTAPDPAIGRIKDMGSAAVGVALLIAGITWLVAIAERVGLW
jgi:diacylglycerol kinase (ATP)